MVLDGAGAGAGQECLEVLFSRHWRNGTIGDLTPQTDRFEDASEEFSRDCHLAAHEVGKNVVASGGDVVHHVATTPVGFGRRCTGGLIHGLFDALALEEDPLGSWEDLAASCGKVMQAAAGKRDADNGCAEGMGHLLWNAQVGTDEVPDRCARLVERLSVVTCVVSFFMEMYFSRPEFRLRPAPATWMQDAEWADLCTEFRGRGGYAGQGCAAAAAYVWLHPPPLERVLQSVKDRRSSMGTRDDRAAELVDRMREKCSLFPLTDERGACMFQMAGDVSRLDRGIDYFCEKSEGMQALYCMMLQSRTG